MSTVAAPPAALESLPRNDPTATVTANITRPIFALLWEFLLRRLHSRYCALRRSWRLPRLD